MSPQRQRNITLIPKVIRWYLGTVPRLESRPPRGEVVGEVRGAVVGVPKVQEGLLWPFVNIVFTPKGFIYGL